MVKNIHNSTGDDPISLAVKREREKSRKNLERDQLVIDSYKRLKESGVHLSQTAMCRTIGNKLDSKNLKPASVQGVKDLLAKLGLIKKEWAIISLRNHAALVLSQETLSTAGTARK